MKLCLKGFWEILYFNYDLFLFLITVSKNFKNYIIRVLSLMLILIRAIQFFLNGMLPSLIYIVIDCSFFRSYPVCTFSVFYGRGWVMLLFINSMLCDCKFVELLSSDKIEL